MGGESLLIYVLILVVPVIATININSCYKKYKKENSKCGKSGFEVAREILDEFGLDNVYIVENPGEMTDAYDANRKTVKLSTDVFHGESLASISIAAHECGHAIQDKEGYNWMRIRSMIYPVVSLGQTVAYIFLFLGIILDMMDLLLVAIALSGLGLVFELVTLPVEFDASRKAKKILKDLKITKDKEQEGVDKILNAAAMTYVAGVATSILQILYYVIRIINDNKR